MYMTLRVIVYIAWWGNCFCHSVECSENHKEGITVVVIDSGCIQRVYTKTAHKF